MNFHTLIASDIDGTLIPEESTVIPEAVFTQIRAAYEKGYLFMAASGRQYPSLRALFAPVAEQMAFMGENGGVLYFRDALLRVNAFPRGQALRIAQLIQGESNCEFLAGGAGESNILPKSQTFVRHLTEVQKYRFRMLSDFSEFPEQVVKVAAWCPDGAARHEAYFRAALGDSVHIAVSAETWLDFSCSDKGDGLRAACDIFGISRENTIAFGDNWNDVAMLDYVRRPYIMRTASPQLLARYPNVCASVPEELKRILA